MLVCVTWLKLVATNPSQQAQCSREHTISFGGVEVILSLLPVHLGIREDDQEFILKWVNSFPTSQDQKSTHRNLIQMLEEIADSTFNSDFWIS